MMFRLHSKYTLQILTYLGAGSTEDLSDWKVGTIGSSLLIVSIFFICICNFYLGTCFSLCYAVKHNINE